VAEHLNDEEQLEALKRWWKQNGMPIVAALVLVAGGWFGWHFWQDRQQADAAEAALLHANMLEQLAAYENGDVDKASLASGHAQTLKSRHGDSQYGRYAALVLAKLAVADGDLDGAAGELQWVMDNADDAGMKALAALRLARVEVARGNDDAALGLLALDAPAAMTALRAELEGDIRARQGDAEAARAAYQRALDNLGPADASARPLLELKLSQVAGPGTTVTTGASEEDA